jgi:hypothetical protein
MATSQNGWTVLPIAPSKRRVPDTNIFLTVRPGDAGWLLLRVASWFHFHIEKLDKANAEHAPDDWGWAKRNVRGSDTQVSNHASGTAVDLNAVDHPRGVKGTFTAAEKAAVLRHLAQYKDPVSGKDVIRWGEMYSGTIDGMHFEINATEAAVARVAAKLRELDVPIKPEPPRPTPPLNPEEESVALTDTEIDKIATKVVSKLLATSGEQYTDKDHDGKRDTSTVAQKLAAAASDPFNNGEKLDALAEKVDKLLAALPPAGPTQEG